MLRTAAAFLLTTTLLLATIGHAQSQTTPPTVGVPPIDSVISSLARQDLDAVVNDVEFSPRGCVPAAKATVGSPPTCGAGQTEGTPVQSFYFAQCEGTFMTTLDEVRTALTNLFAKSPVSSIYAVARGGVFDQLQDAYIIAVSPGSTPAGDVTGSLWYVTRSGKIHGMDFGCSPQPLAQSVSSFTPPLTFVIAPGQIFRTPEPAGVALPHTGNGGGTSVGTSTEVAIAAGAGVVALTVLWFAKRRMERR